MAEMEQMLDDESQNSSESEQEDSSREEFAGADDSFAGGGENERLNDRASDDEYAGGEEGEPEQEEKSSGKKTKKKKPKQLASRILEYDIEDMYPEIDLLINKKKHEWDFQDPAIIRALWLESKTNVLADWRMKNSKFDSRKKPALEVRNTLAFTLRKDHRQEKVQQKEEDSQQVAVGNDPPVYKAVQLPTNLTMEVRYNFVRNNPPVPRWYVEHFQTYKKPPFNLHLSRYCSWSQTLRSRWSALASTFDMWSSLVKLNA